MSGAAHSGDDDPAAALRLVVEQTEGIQGMAMSPEVILHVATGTIAVASGATALTVRKGSPLHRGAGNIFFVSMLIMAMAGAYMAFHLPMMISVLVGVFTCYLVVTAWLTVKRPEAVIGAIE